MRALKPVLFSVVMVFLVILVVQNLGVFLEKRTLELNLLVWQYKTGHIPLAVYFLGFFLIGLLVSYFSSLSERFRAKKTIKSHSETVRKLQHELNAFKSQSVASQTPHSEDSPSV
ncbi:MAG: LapA family protein [Deltaproteobacteria bacterium]|jgi:uncharacterized integral membrane protein|nr:LapA family protein [Deltaproteobacteria bacterium]MBW2264957.1 LapA family protein [Deltaproteobacteria bacterium]MBW2317362.1 LapA family protein [Deltaproteobacteria bacterium]